MVLRLQSIRKSSRTEEKISSLSRSCGSDVRLAPEGSKDTLLDICSSPLADFHDCERLQHEMSNQVGNFSFVVECVFCHFRHQHR